MGGTRCLPHIGEGAWWAQDVCLTFGDGAWGHKMITSHWRGGMGSQDGCLTLERGHGGTRWLPHVTWGHKMIASHWGGA